MRPHLLAVTLATLAALPAQVIDTLGGTALSATTGNAKVNLLDVTASRWLTEMEWYLDIPAGANTLTWFVYRHHSRNGLATLEWTQSVTVTGGGGPGWYSSGPLLLQLAAGNHYGLGLAFSSPLTYSFDIGQPAAAFSFGNWQRGMTPPVPLPTQLDFTGSDAARYHQRITTLPTNAIAPVGTPCGAGPGPRLVADGFFVLGTSQTMELVAAAPSALSLFALGAIPTVWQPLPVFGCDLWLNLGAFATVPVLTDATGLARLTLGVPNNPLLAGQGWAWQSLVFAPAGPLLSNAVFCVVN